MDIKSIGLYFYLQINLRKLSLKCSKNYTDQEI